MSGDSVQQLVRFLTLAVAISLVSACTLPRGAALTGEVLKEQGKDNPTFDVVPVTRDNVARLAEWPVTGWSGSYHWLKGTRGPQSNLIRIGDTLDMVIWDSNDNSLLTPMGAKTVNLSEMVVSPDGTIFVPYIGEVVVHNMSVADAREKIQKAMEPSVPSGQVQISLKAGKANSVDLVSGVAQPGTYPLPDRNSSILSLIAQGGGISNQLKNPLVRLLRGSRNYQIRAEKLFSTPSANVVLRGADQIVVQEDDRYFTALGATGSEQLVQFEQEHISVIEALSIIGGINDRRANPKGVIILREYPARVLRTDGGGPKLAQTVFTFDLTTADGLFAARKFQVNPKDTLLATESPVTATRTVLGLIGSIFGAVNTASNAGN
jgi:polysaccharide export outer membrane protein